MLDQSLAVQWAGTVTFIMNVVAAIIARDELILICQRKAGQQYAGKWEFPGGKVEPGEGLQAALARELQEELGITATIGDEIAHYDYAYPGRAVVQLFFYKVSEFAGEPRNLIFEEIRWEKIQNLPRYDFLDGDVEFVRRLAGERPGIAAQSSNKLIVGNESGT
jgi:8-oxo-dGTP diphosphatase